MTEFDISLRGYDRAAVESMVRAVNAAAGDQAAIEAAVRAYWPPIEVLRGYDRAQVDAWLARARAGGVAADPTEVDPPTPEFLVVLRGYRIKETDALVATVAAALASDDPFRRAEALRAIAGPRPPVAFRGYDRRMVDKHLSRAERALAGT
ncbi:hypothetical protein O7635_26855 [Asanoa sp. WMMD1127]|uniref:hypothetical protein n=1 Tax=Asanoa sp. WMMD1127 TaxID=3016107 RepID=UPI00241790D3|nr:hypothetical protein [Asanoa sp. WMMD1127]MDG4825483.1 hypothetical protein [Asanoa sp. WMMD1127]